MYLSCLGAIFTIHMYMIFFLIYVFTLFPCYMYYLHVFNIFWDLCIFPVWVQYEMKLANTSICSSTTPCIYDWAHTHTHTNKHTRIHAHTTICDVMQVIDIYFTIYRQKLWILQVVKLDDFWDVPRTGCFRASWKEAPVLRKKRTLNDVEGTSEITKRFEYHETTNCKGIR